MGKTKYLSAFEQDMVVGARHTGLSVSRTATMLGFPCVSRMGHCPKHILSRWYKGLGDRRRYTQ
jgi:hypothetical protein